MGLTAPAPDVKLTEIVIQGGPVSAGSNPLRPDEKASKASSGKPCQRFFQPADSEGCISFEIFDHLLNLLDAQSLLALASVLPLSFQCRALPLTHSMCSPV
jgi:hypothetical protein